MAQHIPIQTFQRKQFRVIEQGIRKDFSNTTKVLGSLRYQYLGEFTKLHEDDEVFRTTRYIGKGIVFGDTKGEFEIHYNNKTKEIEHIFLVA